MTVNEKILKAKAELFRLLKDPKGYKFGPQDVSIFYMLSQDKEVQKIVKKEQ